MAPRRLGQQLVTRAALTARLPTDEAYVPAVAKEQR